MRVLLLAGLLASTLAQPPQTTEKPKSFFHQIGDVLKETASSLGSAFTDYIKNTGSNLLDNVLPNLAGQLLSGGFWSLIKTAAGSGSSTDGKRDLTAELQAFQAHFQHFIQEAEERSEGLATAIQGLVSNLVSGRLTPQEYLNLVPDIKVNADHILHTLTDGIRQELSSLLGNKRNALDLSALTSILETIEAEGNKVIQQVEQGLKGLTALANPNTLLALLG